MEKQKLAELVMEKMRKKKEQQEKNRPHYEVLRLQVDFQKEINDELKNEVAMLEDMVSKQKKTLKQMQEHLQDLDNTGKRNYPRIIVLPEFIASQHIQPDIKEFFRKASNTFLRSDILRHKNYNQAVEQEKDYIEKIKKIGQLENDLRVKRQKERDITNAKRVKVLKQDLRLRFLKQEQQDIKATIQRQKEEKKDLLRQYEIKKQNLQNRKDHLKYVQQQIVQYKNKIQRAFNPKSYRQHLQNIFDIQMKTQTMQKQLVEVTHNVETLEQQTQRYERTLQRAASLSIIGRTSDSPSTRKGKIQKKLQAERQNRSQYHRRSASALSRCENKSLPSNQQSMRKSIVDLDFSKIGSTAHNSQKTTDRTSHPRFQSELAKQLFT